MKNDKRIVVGSHARLIAEIRKAHKAGALSASTTDELVKLLRHPPHDDRGFDPREGGDLEGRWRPKSAQVRKALHGKLGKQKPDVVRKTDTVETVTMKVKQAQRIMNRLSVSPFYPSAKPSKNSP